MGASFDDPPPVEDDDLVHPLQPGQPVGDEQGGATFGEGEQVGRQRVGGGWIEVLAGLVEHQDGEVGQQGAGDGDPLALPSRQARALRAHGGAQAVGEPAQPGAEADPGEDVHEFGVGGGAPAHPEVLRQGRVEQVGALLDQPDHAPHVVRGEALQGHPVERCLTRIGREETHQHIGQRRLAGAARADQGDAAPGAQLQVHAAQRGAAGARDRRPTPRAR